MALSEALARTFATAELTILSAHIDCYGERAVDAFYVATLDGGKLEDARRIHQLREGLMTVLQAGEPDASTPSARPKRQKARASIGR